MLALEKSEAKWRLDDWEIGNGSRRTAVGFVRLGRIDGRGLARRPCSILGVIPFHERHLQQVLREWVRHYHRGRPHTSLGPDVPEPWPDRLTLQPCGHRLPPGRGVVATPILAGLHHEYRVIQEAA